MGSPPSKRDYKKEYKWQGTPEQIANRSARNKARRAAKKRGANVAGKDVGHIKSLKSGGSKSPSNTRVQSRSSNRSHGGKISSGTKGKKLTRRKR